MMSFWMWVLCVSVTLGAALAATGVLLYKREARRVGGTGQLDEGNDAAQDELLDDYRGRAVKRIQQIKKLGKSPSQLRLALKAFWKKRRDTHRIMADGLAERGDGMRSLYTQPGDLRMANQPLVRSGSQDDVTQLDSLAGRGGGQPADEALLKRRAFAFATLKKNFTFLNPDQLAALCVDASEVHLRRGELLVAEGTEVATPSLYIVEKGQLECTCEGGAWKEAHAVFCCVFFRLFFFRLFLFLFASLDFALCVLVFVPRVPG